MGLLSAEAEALAGASAAAMNRLNDKIEALASRVSALEANSGGGGGSPVTYSGGVASTDANGTTIYWLAGTSNPTS